MLIWIITHTVAFFSGTIIALFIALALWGEEKEEQWRIKRLREGI
jgi:hypothetical protein